MTSHRQFAQAVADLAAPPTIRRRVVDPVSRFDAFMRNDFLTPRGTPYKWQELRAGVARTVSGPASPTLVPAAYTWLEVESRTGQHGCGPDDGAWTAWTFARGQAFHAVLSHSDVRAGPAGVAVPPGVAVPAGPAGPAGTERPLAPSAGTQVSYPDLLRSPSVDLLVMLSWDVLMFETMCTSLVTAPELHHTGVSADLTRVSGTWGSLQFSDPRTAAVFRNSEMTATKLGYGMRDGRPTAVFSYQCVDCPLTAHAGPLSQDGRSSYWGTVQVDLRTGDLVAGEMVEVIVATQTDGEGKQAPVHRRRMVRLRAAGAESPDPVDPAGPGVASVPLVVTPVAGTVVREADRMARQVHSRLRSHVDALVSLPESMASLAEMGFRSLVGLNGPEAVELVAALRADLRGWAGGDDEAATRVNGRWASYVRALEGLVAYCDASAGEAARLGNLDQAALAGLQRALAAFNDDLTALIGLLDRLVPPGSESELYAKPLPPNG